MRISDAMISANYMKNLNKSREKITRLEEMISTEKKILAPSDDPSGTAKVINMQTKLTNASIYQENIDSSLSVISEALSSMELMTDTTSDILTLLTDAEDSTLSSSELESIADQIDEMLSSLLDYANQEYDGKYLFGGTSTSTAPFAYSSDGLSVVTQTDITGTQYARITEGILQQINIPGSEIFSTIITQSGNLNSTSAVGTASTSTTSVYDADGTEYTLNVTYTKTAANTYSMTYDVLDSDSNSILTSAPAAQTFVFDSSTGKLKSVDGSTPDEISISIDGTSIEFNLDATTLKETSSTSTISCSANQETNIFNTLISIRDTLANGDNITDAQKEAVQSFYDNLVNKTSELGNIENQINNIDTLLTERVTNLTEQMSNITDADLTELYVDLETQNTILEMTYEMAAMVLPKSLLDYL